MPAREVHVSNSEGMLPRSSLASHSIGKDAVPLPPSRRAEKTEGVSTRVRPDKNSEGKIRRDGYFFGDKSLIFIFFVPEELN